jgi:hypothetical protein
MAAYPIQTIEPIRFARAIVDRARHVFGSRDAIGRAAPIFAPRWTRRSSHDRSHEEEVVDVQCAELHVLEHQGIVVIKGDDHVVAALVAVRGQLAEAREEP